MKSQAALGKRAGINQRTVGRILKREHSTGLDKIEALAKVFDVEPWRLLAPNLGREAAEGAYPKEAVAEQMHVGEEQKSWLTQLTADLLELLDEDREKFIADLHTAAEKARRYRAQPVHLVAPPMPNDRRKRKDGSANDRETFIPGDPIRSTDRTRGAA